MNNEESFEKGIQKVEIPESEEAFRKWAELYEQYMLQVASLDEEIRKERVEAEERYRGFVVNY